MLVLTELVVSRTRYTFRVIHKHRIPRMILVQRHQFVVTMNWFYPSSLSAMCAEALVCEITSFGLSAHNSHPLNPLRENTPRDPHSADPLDGSDVEIIDLWCWFGRQRRQTLRGANICNFQNLIRELFPWETRPMWIHLSVTDDDRSSAEQDSIRNLTTVGNTMYSLRFW